jgi:hypothetical protein
MNEDDLVRTNVDFLLTETLLDTSVPPEKVIAVLRARKTTGQLTVHMSQGGIQRVVLTEKTKASDSEAQKIRAILWNGSK